MTVYALAYTARQLLSIDITNGYRYQCSFLCEKEPHHYTMKTLDNSYSGPVGADTIFLLS